MLVAASLGVLVLGQRRTKSTTSADDADTTRAFFRDQLEGIDRDQAAGRLSEEQAASARAELAREVMRHERENPVAAKAGSGRMAMIAILPVIAVTSLGVYGWIGRSDLPALPLAGREVPEGPMELDLGSAIALVEAQMVANPGDVRGWLVLAPIYMDQGRYGEAANAWRRVLSLEPPTADRETGLAEALILANEGQANEEALGLLRSAMTSDPVHIRSRFYLAGELTRMGEYAEGAELWQELLALATGEEPWVDTARAGLIAAEAGLTGDTLGGSEPDATMDVMIRGMVEGLAARIADEGGTAAEWMQLVRSRFQLDGAEAAREDLERGRAALADNDRLALDDLANELGLTE